MFFGSVEMISGIWMLAVVFMLNVENNISLLVFKLTPAVLGVLLIVDSLNKFGLIG